MDAAIVAKIEQRLARLRAEHNVRIPLAIESGSRAWGFPSPDSDYDCRFVFVRRQRDYLSLWRQRDVIETPLDKVFDVNGWDLAKALKLLLKGNAVVIEWLMSPIRYETDDAFRDEFLRVAKAVADRALIGRHYLHLGERQRRTYFREGKTVPQKKIFYALRPAAALRWLRLHPGEAVVPMHFPTMLTECDPPSEIADLAAALVEKKAKTRELASEPLPEPIGRFIDAEFEAARSWTDAARAAPSPAARTLCDAFFAETVARFDAN
ncbi:MAG TPA: nucleotidyltransferase domain-containing protein [Rhizomicrobium sp.]|nr:nucleotidyltransferase domain-containing protein [Rhizomicrobium sp.]